MLRLVLALIIIFNSFGLANANLYANPQSHQSGLDWDLNAYKNYLAKIVPQNPFNTSFKESPYKKTFDFANLNYDEKIKKWLSDVDARFNNSKLQNFNADFEMTLNKDGYITSLNILELREHNYSKFKDFLAQFTTKRFPQLPESLPENTKFVFNTEWFYLDRRYDAEEEELIENESEEALEADNQSLKELTKINEFTDVEITLIKPNYIDFPRVGEKIIFRTEATGEGLPLSAVFKGRIVDVGKKHMTILSSKVKLANGKVATKDMLWRIDADEFDKGSNMMASMTSGAITWMSTVGLSTAISTHGIAAGGAVALGAISGWLKERGKTHSFNLSKNETIKVKQGGLKKWHK